MPVLDQLRLVGECRGVDADLDGRCLADVFHANLDNFGLRACAADLVLVRLAVAVIVHAVALIFCTSHDAHGLRVDGLVGVDAIAGHHCRPLSGRGAQALRCARTVTVLVGVQEELGATRGVLLVRAAIAVIVLGVAGLGALRVDVLVGVVALTSDACRHGRGR